MTAAQPTLGELEDGGVVGFQNGFPCGTWNEQGYGVVHLRPFNVSSTGQIDLTSIKYAETDRKLGPYLLAPGDVIFNNTNSEDLVGKTALWIRSDPAVLSNHMTIVRVLKPNVVDPAFLSLYLFKLWSDGFFRATCRRHVNQASVGLETLREVVVPPFKCRDQRRIAAFLGLLREDIKLHASLDDLARALKRALLEELFTRGIERGPTRTSEAGAIPASWKVARLGNLAELKSGGTPRRSEAAFWKDGTIPWVKTGEINYVDIHDTGEKITPAGLAQSSARLFPAGTLLMAMYGQGVTRGRVAMLGIEASTNQACVAFFPSRDVRSKFLYFYFEYKYDAVRDLGHGANQKNLSAEIIKSVPVAYPPTSNEQDEIVKTLELVDAKIAGTRAKQGILEELSETLLPQLMSGTLSAPELDYDALTPVGGVQTNA